MASGDLPWTSTNRETAVFCYHNSYAEYPLDEEMEQKPDFCLDRRWENFPFCHPLKGATLAKVAISSLPGVDGHEHPWLTARRKVLVNLSCVSYDIFHLQQCVNKGGGKRKI